MKTVSIFNDNNYAIKECIIKYNICKTTQFDNLEDFFQSNSDIFLIGHTTALYVSIDNWKKILENYFKNTNKLLIIGGCCDGIIHLKRFFLENKLDSVFENYKNNICFFYIGILENCELKNKLEKFKNFQLSEIETEVSQLLDIFQNLDLKDNSLKDNKFLLTTILRKNRINDKAAHRFLLKDLLVRKNLLEYHVGNISEVDSRNNVSWQGTVIDNFFDPAASISWDLYNQSSFEIIPESVYEDFTFITEKTWKPLFAEMPFLILSNPNFYKHLKYLGFKTFDSLIDESFADETNLNLRVEKLVNSVKYILDNNAVDFYHTAQDICSYNKDHLFYLSKKHEYIFRQNVYEYFSKL